MKADDKAAYRRMYMGNRERRAVSTLPGYISSISGSGGGKVNVYVRYLAIYFLIVCATSVFILSGCKYFNRDYRRTLPNGYELVRISPHEVEISSSKDDNKIVVFPDIDGYSVNGNLVVGHVSIPDIDDIWYPVTPGYFILDTVSDKLYQGLEKEKWLRRLKEYGTTEEPSLRRFTRFDRNY